MRGGRWWELGPTEGLFEAPGEEYGRELPAGIAGRARTERSSR